MEGKVLRIASINHPPYVIVNETRENEWELIGGIDALVINILRDKFRFTSKAVVPPEKDWGNLVGGSWTGVMGMVYRNEVDIGISNMMMTESRYESVNFSVPYNSDGWILISPAARFYENKHAVLQPFTREVWCSLLLTIGISLCLLLLLQKVRSTFRVTPRISWENTLWNLVAILCQEGIRLEKMNRSIIYFIIWIYCAMILQISYGGVLIGFLTFPAKEPSISTLEELAHAIKYQGYKISLKKFSMAEHLLTNHEIYGELFTRTIRGQAEPPVPMHADGFRLVRTKKFVFIANEFGCLYDLYNEDYSQFQRSSVLDRNYIAIAASRSFGYLSDFNIVLRRLSERGLIIKWRSDILTSRLMKAMFQDKEDEEDETASTSTKPLTIAQLQGAFLLLGGGYLVAFVCLLLEILRKNHFKDVK